MIARALLAVLAAAVAFLGVHLALAVAAAVIVVILAALGLSIAILVAECGWGVQPCRRRFAW
jgi:hypothetical protein